MLEFTMPQALALVGMALSVGMAGLGSAFGVGVAGAAASGAVSSEPDNFVRPLILQQLPQTQGIYGFLVALFIFANLDAITTIPMGIAALMAGLAMGIAGLTGIGQGITVSGGISGIAKNKDVFGKVMVFGVMAEFFAILGLLTSILILIAGQIF